MTGSLDQHRWLASAGRSCQRPLSDASTFLVLQRYSQIVAHQRVQCREIGSIYWSDTFMATKNKDAAVEGIPVLMGVYINPVKITMCV